MQILQLYFLLRTSKTSFVVHIKKISILQWSSPLIIPATYLSTILKVSFFIRNLFWLPTRFYLYICTSKCIGQFSVKMRRFSYVQVNSSNRVAVRHKDEKTLGLVIKDFWSVKDFSWSELSNLRDALLCINQAYTNFWLTWQQTDEKENRLKCVRWKVEWNVLQLLHTFCIEQKKNRVNCK